MIHWKKERRKGAQAGTGWEVAEPANAYGRVIQALESLTDGVREGTDGSVAETRLLAYLLLLWRSSSIFSGAIF